MLRISSQDLNEGKKMVHLVTECPDVLDCLWRGKECKQKCKLPFFRRIFERNSPAFYGLYRRLADCDAILSDLAHIELEGDSDQKHEAHERFHDLQTFAQASLLLLYPLFLTNNEDVPFVNKKEIEEVERTYLEADPEKAKDELEQINSDWWDLFVMISSNFCDSETYAKRCYLLVRLFLRGMEKYGPPQGFVSNGEKAEFFEAVESFIRGLTV